MGMAGVVKSFSRMVCPFDDGTESKELWTSDCLMSCALV